MRKVSEYEQHAAECRERAAQMKDLTYKKEFEDLAEAWVKLARTREAQLKKQRDE
jgi:hypothetical protein